MVAGGVLQKNLAGAAGFAGSVPDWQKQFLNDINAPITPQNVTFLSAWNQAEGKGSLGYNNPFNTTLQQPGSSPINSVGVQSYPNMQEGVMADAKALMENHPGYATLLNALRTGNIDPAVMGQDLSQTPWGTGAGASNVLNQWGDKLPQGYNTLTGYQNAQIQQNAPQILQGTIQAGNLQEQQLLNQLMTGQQSQFARQEAGFQLGNIGLSQQQLGISRGALARQEKLIPREYGLERQQFGLQGADIAANRASLKREYQQNLNNMIAGEAGAGSLFTKGARDTRSLARFEESQALAANTRQRQSLGIQERGAALGFKEQMASLKDEGKNLNILAKRYGISIKEVQARLANTLKEMGYAGMMTTSDLASQLASTNIQTWSLGNPAIPFGFPMTGGLNQPSPAGGLPNYTGGQTFQGGLGRVG